MSGIEITKEKIIIILEENKSNGTFNVLMYDKDKEKITEIKIIRSNYEIKEHLTLKIEDKTRLKVEFADIWFIDNYKKDNETLTLDLNTHKYL